MPHLHEALAARVSEWSEAGHPHDEHPAIAEILECQHDQDPGSSAVCWEVVVTRTV